MNTKNEKAAPTEEEIKEAQAKDKARLVKNLKGHLREIQGEMEKINVKLLTTDYLKHTTIVHEMKRYLELTSASAYIIQVGQWAFPEDKPVEAEKLVQEDILTPESIKLPSMSVVN